MEPKPANVLMANLAAETAIMHMERCAVSSATKAMCCQDQVSVNAVLVAAGLDRLQSAKKLTVED